MARRCHRWRGRQVPRTLCKRRRDLILEKTDPATADRVDREFLAARKAIGRHRFEDRGTGTQAIQRAQHIISIVDLDEIERPAANLHVGRLGRGEHRHASQPCVVDLRGRLGREQRSGILARGDRDVDATVVFPVGLLDIELDAAPAQGPKEGGIREPRRGRCRAAVVRNAANASATSRVACLQPGLRPKGDEAFMRRVVDLVLHDGQVACRHRRAVRADYDEVTRMRAARKVVRIITMHDDNRAGLEGIAHSDGPAPASRAAEGEHTFGRSRNCGPLRSGAARARCATR